MFLRTLITLAASVTLMASISASAAEKWCDSSDIIKSDRLPCFAKIISWVELSHQGDHADLFEQNKNSLESFARMRVRNDISSLEHEVLYFDDALAKYKLDLKSRDMKERIGLHCHVWWVGKEFPVAQHVECSLWGYGYFAGAEFELSSSSLGYSNSRALIEQTQSSIRSIIGTIAADFYKYLDMTDH